MLAEDAGAVAAAGPTSAGMTARRCRARYLTLSRPHERGDDGGNWFGPHKALPAGPTSAGMTVGRTAARRVTPGRPHERGDDGAVIVRRPDRDPAGPTSAGMTGR